VTPKRWLLLLATLLVAATFAPTASARPSSPAPRITCPAGWADADGNPANGCETSLMTSLSNCGALGVMVPAGGQCVGGVVIPPPAARPSRVDLTLRAQPASGIMLGQQAGATTCTGDGDAKTCVMPIGLKTSLYDRVPVHDNSTGRDGTLALSCSVMFSGLSTSYATTPGTTQATGSQDCSLYITFSGGDVLVGTQHQTRVVRGSTQTMTFDTIFTGGLGAYAGFQGAVHTQQQEPWTSPPPLNQQEGKRGMLPRLRIVLPFTARARAGGGKGGRARIVRSKRPLASFATIGLLLPRNRPLVVKAAAAPTAVCTGTIVGATTIDLGKAVADAKGSAAFKALPAGTFADGADWHAHVTCKGGGMGTASSRLSLTGYDVLSS